LGFRIVWPAILSIVGTSMLMVLGAGAVLLGGLAAGESHVPAGSVDFTPYVLIGLSGLIGLALSLALLLDEKRRRYWGILLLGPCGIASYFFIKFLVLALQTATEPLSPFAYVLFSVPFWGVAGAVWGIFWNKLTLKPTQTFPQSQ
jgi:hypothetical protein